MPILPRGTIQDFDQSIKLDTAYAKPINSRGAAYLRKGEYDPAIQSFDEAIKLQPSYGGAFANRAGAYLKKNEYDRAAQDYDKAVHYDKAVRLEPNREAVWNGRCWTRAILGSLQAALEDCNKAVLSWPNNAAPYDPRGLIYLKMGEPGAAIDDYSCALRFDPKLASAPYGRGLAKLAARPISLRQGQLRPGSMTTSRAMACAAATKRNPAKSPVGWQVIGLVICRSLIHSIWPAL